MKVLTLIAVGLACVMAYHVNDEDETARFRWSPFHRPMRWNQRPTGRPQLMRPTGRPSTWSRQNFWGNLRDKMAAWKQKMSAVADEDETARFRWSPFHRPMRWNQRPTGRPQLMRPTGRPNTWSRQNFWGNLRDKMAAWVKKQKMSASAEEDETARFRWSPFRRPGYRPMRWDQRPTGRPQLMRPTGRPSARQNFLKAYHDKMAAWWKKQKDADETMHHHGPHHMGPHHGGMRPTGRPMHMGPHHMAPHHGMRPTGRPMRPNFMKAFHDKVAAWWNKQKDTSDDADETMHHHGPHHMGPHGGMRPTGRPMHMGPHHMAPHHGMRPTGRPMMHWGPHGAFHMGHPNFLKDLHIKATTKMEDEDETDIISSRKSHMASFRQSIKDMLAARSPTGRPKQFMMALSQKLKEARKHAQSHRPTGRPSADTKKVEDWLKRLKDLYETTKKTFKTNHKAYMAKLAAQSKSKH